MNRATVTSVPQLGLDSSSVVALHQQLYRSLSLRTNNVPLPPKAPSSHAARVAVLFSGGLDCTVLARMLHDLLPSERQIDLLNIAFENPRVMQAALNHQMSQGPGRKAKRLMKNGTSKAEDVMLEEPLAEVASASSASVYEACPDRITGRKAFEELKAVCQQRNWNFVAVSSSGLLINRGGSKLTPT